MLTWLKKLRKEILRQKENFLSIDYTIHALITQLSMQNFTIFDSLISVHLLTFSFKYNCALSRRLIVQKWWSSALI